MNMMTRYLAILFALGCFSGPARGDQPKSYSIVLGEVSRIGAAEIQPGNYKLLLHSHSPQVLLKEQNGGKETGLDATVATADSKFEHTAIQLERVDGVRRIVEIRIGGSKTRIAFK